MRSVARVVLLTCATQWLAACLLFGPSEGGELSSAMARWRARGLNQYEFTLSYSCDCPYQPLRIRVSGDAIVQVTDLATGNPTTPDSRAKTIPGLFGYIRSILDRHPDWIQVDYDPDLGFPLDVGVDYDRRAIDDEGGFSVSDLVQVP